MLFRITSMCSDVVPLRTFKALQPIRSRGPHSALHVLRKCVNTACREAFVRCEIRDAAILQKTNSAGLVADPETTISHRGDDRDIAREKISSGQRMVGLKAFTIKSNEAIVRSEPKKTISSLSDRGNTARRTFSNCPAPMIELVKALASSG